MAYSDIALLQSDSDFIMRTAAAASTQPQIDGNPLDWAYAHMWDMAGQPSFGDKYAYALASGVVRPGNDPSVISDPEILAAVQSIEPGTQAAEPAADDDEPQQEQG